MGAVYQDSSRLHSEDDQGRPSSSRLLTIVPQDCKALWPQADILSLKMVVSQKYSDTVSSWWVEAGQSSHHSFFFSGLTVVKVRFLSCFWQAWSEGVGPCWFYLFGDSCHFSSLLGLSYIFVFSMNFTKSLIVFCMLFCLMSLSSIRCCPYNVCPIFENAGQLQRICSVYICVLCSCYTRLFSKILLWRYIDIVFFIL